MMWIIYIIVLLLWWRISQRQVAANMQEVGRASLTDVICGAASSFHIVMNNSGGNQNFSVSIENTGEHCTIEVKWKELPPQYHPHQILLQSLL